MSLVYTGVFDVEQKKNVKDSIILNFNEPVNADSVTEDKFTVSNGDAVLDIDVSVIDEDSVEIKLNDAIAICRYIIEGVSL